MQNPAPPWPHQHTQTHNKKKHAGTSAYGFNPATGRINRHVDTWDSVANQKFFSAEAFGDFLRQLGQRHLTPQGLEAPRYALLRRARDYQVRRYAPFLVAEAPLDGCGAPGGDQAAAGSSGGGGEDGGGSGSGSDGGGVSPAGPGVKAFRALAGYLFGANAEGRKMRMTTPVLSRTDGTMAFVIGPSDAKVCLCVCVCVCVCAFCAFLSASVFLGDGQGLAAPSLSLWLAHGPRLRLYLIT